MLKKVLFPLILISLQSGFSASEKLVLSILNLDCQSCAHEAIEVMNKKKLVKSAAYDLNKVEISLTYDPDKVKKSQIIDVLKADGLKYKEGAGHGYYEKSTEFSEDMDVLTISKKGEKVNIKKHLVKNKVTVFDFYAIWCGPCREVDQEMIKIMQKQKDVALRKLNMVDWKSPLTKKYLSKVSGLPYLIVYSKKGKKLGEVAGLDLKKLNKIIDKGLNN